MTQSVRKPQPNHGSSTFDLFARLDVELWFVKRLEEHGYHVFMGTTDEAVRRERIREAIIARGCEMTIIGRHPASGKPETYAGAFERFYGELLQPKRKGKSP